MVLAAVVAATEILLLIHFNSYKLQGTEEEEEVVEVEGRSEERGKEDLGQLLLL